MSAKAKNGKVIFRRWDGHSGLDETTTSFVSLDELFELCLQDQEQLLVNRVTIEGNDANGNERIVTLEFQSVTVTERRPPDS